jgi:ubiquinone/menaquinone biosynthesis C-methylase UbiE
MIPFQLSMPQAYDKWLVPHVFEPWGKVLLDRIDLAPGHHVLDVATGPGTIARLASLRVGESGLVVATDIAPPMLDLARSKPAVPGGAPIQYVRSAAAPLAVPSRSFDLAACQQGLQFFPDRVAALSEMKRALRPGGRLAIAHWADISQNLYFVVIKKALLRHVGGHAVEVIEAPFSWPHPLALRQAIEAAGFAQIDLVTETREIVFEGGVAEALAALAAMPVFPIVEALSEIQRTQLYDTLAAEFERLIDGTALRAKSTCHIVTAQA